MAYLTHFSNGCEKKREMSQAFTFKFKKQRVSRSAVMKPLECHTC